MFEYNIYSEPNEARYRECIVLLKHLIEVFYEKELHDVDGSMYTILKTPSGTATVKNSEYVGAVYVESTFDLSNIFKF